MKNLLFLLITSLIVFSCGSNEVVGESNKSYIQMDSEVGCKSQLGDEKKEDVFKEEFKDRWMTIDGEVADINGNQLSLQCDLTGGSDVFIDFEDKKEIYDLKKGSFLRVKFVMRNLGGCFENYSGDKGEIIKKDMPIEEFNRK
jgi:hypothetical protein